MICIVPRDVCSSPTHNGFISCVCFVLSRRAVSSVGFCRATWISGIVVLLSCDSKSEITSVIGCTDVCEYARTDSREKSLADGCNNDKWRERERERERKERLWMGEHAGETPPGGGGGVGGRLISLIYQHSSLRDEWEEESCLWPLIDACGMNAHYCTVCLWSSNEWRATSIKMLIRNRKKNYIQFADINLQSPFLFVEIHL